LYGKDPELFYQAAHVVCELGFDGLDINMGCPSRNVASSGAGAGLIRTPDLAHAIIRAARQGIADWTAGQTLEGAGLKPARVDTINRLKGQREPAATRARLPVPLSVKTRLGYDEVIVERWIEHLLSESPAVISLHGRTLQQMYRGEADWSAIARAVQVARGSRTLLLGNGDVQNLSDVVRRVCETRVDGVLVGRAALGDGSTIGGGPVDTRSCSAVPRAVGARTSL
jgi:tRNA-dihydrouridine synthase